MLNRLSLRRRFLALFAGLLLASLGVAGLALWRLSAGGSDALVQAAMLAGFGLAGLVVGLWSVFDRRVALPIEQMQGALRTGQGPEGLEAGLLEDLGGAVRDAARARTRSAEALAEAVRHHAAELEQEKVLLEAILADIGAGAVLTDARGRVLFYNASAARLLPGLALDRMLERHLNVTALQAAQLRLQAGAAATDLSCLSFDGRRLSGRLRGIAGGLLLILRDEAGDGAAPRAALEALRRHAATLVPLLDALDGPIPPAVAQAIRAEGQGLAAATRALSAVLAGDPSGAAASLEELAAGLDTGGPLPRLTVRARAAPLNALLRKLDASLRAKGHVPTLAVQPDDGERLRLVLEWRGAPLTVDALERLLRNPPDPGQPDLCGAEILAAQDTGIWPEGEGTTSRVVLPLRIVPDDASGSGVTYDFALAGRQAASTRLADLTCVVFDTETTGLAPTDRIVQVAGLRLVRSRLTGERFETLVNPGRPIPKAATAIHGITDAMVADAPGLRSALEAFRHFSEDAVLIAHNAPFDMGFLRGAEAESGVRFPNRVLDTVLLSAMVWGMAAPHSLDALAQRLDVAIPPEARHTAMGDALATAAVFLRLLPALEAKGITTFEEAVAQGRRFRRLIPDANLRG